MFDRFRKSFLLVKESFRLLMLDKELLLFPLLSGLCLMLILLTYILPVFAAAFRGEEQSDFFIGALGWAWLFGFYILSYFIGIFFNVALISCVAIRLKGKDPRFSDGIKAAFRNIHKIAAWALVSATVGIILRSIEERSNFLGKLAISLVGMAWALLTFFVVPVMIFENLGVFASIKRSGQLFKNTWGESVIGQFSIGLLFGFVILLSVFAFVGAVFLGAFAGTAVLVTGITIVGIVFVLSMLLSSVLQSIYLTALYTYASSKKMPSGFSKEFIAEAYRKK
ncbi:hypothetical protein HYV81_00975 [Candidatus Woesearchaeota archaeon]|nr:hypothetical protein [Candidatus Woesearchaeota archaeon]